MLALSILFVLFLFQILCFIYQYILFPFETNISNKQRYKEDFSVEQIARAIDMNIKDVAAIVAGKVPSNV